MHSHIYSENAPQCNAVISIRTNKTSPFFVYLKGTLSMGLMDGRGVFTGADGLKYDVRYNIEAL